ncbi:uncharacterized protein [Procambarus clarkii]|uniref:uncharacterized protein isoform X2 n=1 Tax=Procambarus clarkii TaxID=6728 RepID=UPI0037444C43
MTNSTFGSNKKLKMKWRSTRSNCYYFIIISALFVCSSANQTPLAIVLEDNGNQTECVPECATDHDTFCLAIYSDGKPLAGKGFQFFFQQHLVYNCSSEGKCSAYEPLSGNVHTDVTCSGLPFFIINENHIGSYELRLDDNRTSDPFHLSYCPEPIALVVELTWGSKTVEDVTLDQKEQDYCLQVKLDNGSPASAFQCALNGSLVYTCRSFDDCEGSGVLATHRANPRNVSKNSCSGIPFANMSNQLYGQYSCWMERCLGKNISGLKDVYPSSEPIALVVELTWGSKTVEDVTLDQKEQDYCLQVKLDNGSPASAFQCALNGSLVYTCRSFDDCEGSGVLATHRANPRNVSKNSCSGIPFANMSNQLYGQYSCWMERCLGKNISGLKDVYPSSEPIALVVELTWGSKTVEDVTLDQNEQDYCLQVKLDNGSPASAFQCALNRSLVYTCRSFDDCEGSGVLATHRANPRNVSKNSCSGIPFANMSNQLHGRYSCWMETSLGKNISGFTDVYPNSAEFPLLSCVVVIIILGVGVGVVVVIIILVVVIRYLRSSRHRYEKAQGTPV